MRILKDGIVCNWCLLIYYFCICFHFRWGGSLFFWTSVLPSRVLSQWQFFHPFFQHFLLLCPLWCAGEGAETGGDPPAEELEEEGDLVQTGPAEGGDRQPHRGLLCQGHWGGVWPRCPWQDDAGTAGYKGWSQAFFFPFDVAPLCNYLIWWSITELSAVSDWPMVLIGVRLFFCFRNILVMSSMKRKSLRSHSLRTTMMNLMKTVQQI